MTSLLKAVDNLADTANAGRAAAKAASNAVDAAKAAARAASNITDSAFRATYKFDLGGIGKSMKHSDYFKKLDLPDQSLKTSSLFHTPDALNALKKADLVPKSTSDLMKSVSKSVDDVSLKSLDDITATLKKVDVGDIKAVTATAKKSSLGKLKDISTQLSQQAQKRARIGGDSKLTKQIDDAADTANAKAFKNADDMTAAMKNTKRASKKVDDVTEASGKAAKNKGLDVIDDVAEKAKKNSLYDKLKWAKNNDGKIAMGLVATYMMGEYVHGQMFNYDVSPEDLAKDPSDEDVAAAISAAIEQASASGEVTTIDESELGGNNILASNATLLGVAAVASMVL